MAEQECALATLNMDWIISGNRAGASEVSPLQRNGGWSSNCVEMIFLYSKFIEMIEWNVYQH